MAVFAVAESTPAILQRLAREGFEVRAVDAVAGTAGDAAGTAEIAQAKQAGWIVTDGYSFGVEYQRRIKDKVPNLLCVDDNGEAGGFVADVILNQNLHARRGLYREREPGARLLLGPRYGLLRREFKPWLSWQRATRGEASRVLVTMGGSDALNLSERVIRAIQSRSMGNLEITVVAGGSSPHLAGLRAMREELGSGLRLMMDVNDMPELMAWADVAVSAAGSTCWEMCRLGLPAIVIDVALNQGPLAGELEREGVAIHVPLSQATGAQIAEKLEGLMRSRGLRARMAKRGAELVDGLGAWRVVAAMRAQAIRVRRAQAGDCRILWEWANERAVRQASFESAAIPWEQHSRWFEQKLGDPASTVLMFEEDGSTPAGTVRFQATTSGDAEISVTVGPEFRGQGLAPYFLDRAVERVFELSSLERIHAYIRVENPASAKSFEPAGFFLVGTTQIKGNEALHYVRERERVANIGVGDTDKAVETARCR